MFLSGVLGWQWDRAWVNTLLKMFHCMDLAGLQFTFWSWVLYRSLISVSCRDMYRSTLSGMISLLSIKTAQVFKFFAISLSHACVWLEWGCPAASAGLSWDRLERVAARTVILLRIENNKSSLLYVTCDYSASFVGFKSVACCWHHMPFL
jgi:hypothetical protein